MAYNQAAAERLRALIGDHPDVVEKKMFGGVSFMMQGNMAVGVNKDDLIVRIDKNDNDAALAKAHARQFDFTGKPMAGWIMVAPQGYESDEDLQAWVDMGIDYALSLPPK